MGKYVNGFNRFYTNTAPAMRYVTAGLTLFCRFHNDFQVILINRICLSY